MASINMTILVTNMWRTILCLLCMTVLSNSITSTTTPRSQKIKLNPVVVAVHKYKVVPDVIAISPDTMLKVSYRFGVKEMYLGENLTSLDTENPPDVTWTGSHKNNFYSLCMITPDVPTRANSKDKQWLQWLVVNIPGFNITKGDTIAEYAIVGPYLNRTSGIHRNVLLVFQQPSKLTFDEPKISKRSTKNRSKFSILKFASKYKLKNPIAINFYQTQYDDYVPIIFKINNMI